MAASASPRIGICKVASARRAGHHCSRPPPSVRQAGATSLLLDHPDLDLRAHIGVEADRDAIDAERTNRLVQVDLTLLDVMSLGLELMRDVGGGDGAEQL